MFSIALYRHNVSNDAVLVEVSATTLQTILLMKSNLNKGDGLMAELRSKGEVVHKAEMGNIAHHFLANIVIHQIYALIIIIMIIPITIIINRRRRAYLL